ncbi:MAG TPA: PilZ domain-containing protein, partial [Kofleriaceae bacterium]|nr:PilZ domain-containing protein [Kofleriaceae bacterium]
MLRLVTTNNVEVFRHLGSSSFQRLGLDHKVVSSYDEALGAVRSMHPSLAIVDVILSGGTGYDLCRTIKDDPELTGTHVILILSSMINRDALERIEASGCDDILALPIHHDDFYHHLAQIADLPFRRDRRIGVTLEVLIPAGPGEDAEVLTGTVLNVSSRGVGVQVKRSFENGQRLAVRFRHDGQVFPEAQATVAWTKPASGGSPGEHLAGLEFDDRLPMRTKLLLEQLALFDVVPAAADSPMAGGVTVSLQGDFTEITNFAALSERLEAETKIDFDASAVRYISSAGVRGWCQFLKTLGDEKTYSFRHCSMAFASQAAMVPMVVGTGNVLSLEAPYFCEKCDREELRLLETRALVCERDHIIPLQL